MLFFNLFICLFCYIYFYFFPNVYLFIFLFLSLLINTFIDFYLFISQRQQDLLLKEGKFKQIKIQELIALQKRIQTGREEQKKQRHQDLERYVRMSFILYIDYFIKKTLDVLSLQNFYFYFVFYFSFFYFLISIIFLIFYDKFSFVTKYFFLYLILIFIFLFLSLLQRYQNVKAELEAQQNLERIKM